MSEATAAATNETLPSSARAVIVGAGIVGRERRPPPRARGLDRPRDRRPGAAVGDGRLDVPRARARLPAQPVAHDDPARAGDGRPAVAASSSTGCPATTRSAASRSRRPRSAGPSSTAATAARGATASTRRCCRRPRSPSASRSSTPTGSSAACSSSATGSRRPSAAPRRWAARRPRRAARGRSARPRRPGSSSRAAACAASRRRAARSRPTPSSSAPASGGRRRRGCSAACGSRSCPCSTSTRTPRRCRSSRAETREVVHPILRHQDHSMYFRQHGGRLRDRQLPPRAAADRARGHPPGGRRDAAVDGPVHRRGLRDRGARDGLAAARRRPRRR